VCTDNQNCGVRTWAKQPDGIALGENTTRGGKQTLNLWCGSDHQHFLKNPVYIFGTPFLVPSRLEAPIVFGSALILHTNYVKILIFCM